MDAKERIEKLVERLRNSFEKQQCVLAIIQTRDETIEALCDSLTLHEGRVRKMYIRLQSGELKFKDVHDLYEDRNCYAYIEKDPQVVFKFPAKEMPLDLHFDSEGFAELTTAYEFFLELP
ncbi:MAG: hypothetical protein WC052_06145 [Patescibacteria group bacterium]